MKLISGCANTQVLSVHQSASSGEGFLIWLIVRRVEAHHLQNPEPDARLRCANWIALGCRLWRRTV